MEQTAHTSISLFIPLKGEKGETSVHINERNKFRHGGSNRIPGQTEIGELEIGLLKYGAKVVKIKGRKFVRTRDEIVLYSDTAHRRCLQYEVKML